MIHPYVLFARHEQERFGGMKTRQLDFALGLAKGLLRSRLAQLMDEYCRSSSLGRDCDEVIALAMPSDRRHVFVCLQEGYWANNSAISADWQLRRLFVVFFERDPFDCFTGTRFRSNVSSGFDGIGFGEESFGYFSVIETACARGDNYGAFANTYEEAVMGAVGVPFY